MENFYIAAIFPFLLIQEGQLSFTGKSMRITKYWLIAQEQCILTDRLKVAFIVLTGQLNLNQTNNKTLT